MSFAKLYEETAQHTKFDRVEIASILAIFHELKPVTDKGREETVYMVKIPNDKVQKVPQTKV